MSFKDLRQFMDALRDRGELAEIGAEVDRDLEITEIADRVVKAGGPALLFTNVKDSAYPLLINAFGTYERTAFALGAKMASGEANGRAALDLIAADIADLIDLSSYMGFVGKAKAIPKLARLACVLPLPAPFGAPCQEVIEDEVDLDSIPVLKCWPGDGGRFLTLPLVFTVDPDTGRQNVGMYRMQVYDKRTTGMHWHLHKDGRSIWEKWKAKGGRMPVSVALGCDPAMIYAATAPLPPFIDETMFAGFLRKAPIERVKCTTNDIHVPARAEFVLEGYVDTSEPLREEGPFGDHTGYYSLKGLYPVFHIERITHKKKPIYNCTIVGKPPMEDCYLGKATERIFLPILKMVAPEIVDMNFPLEGVFHNCAIVSIRKKYPGHAKKVMHALWGMGQMMYTKLLIIVDADVDAQDLSTVAWKVFNNIDAARDVTIVDGPLDALDHASPLPHYGHKMGIDATKKWHEEGHDREWPDDIAMSEDIIRLVDGRWKEYGL